MSHQKEPEKLMRLVTGVVIKKKKMFGGVELFTESRSCESPPLYNSVESSIVKE